MRSAWREGTYSKVVRAAECHDLLVREPHTMEDKPKMVGALAPVRKAATRRTPRIVNKVRSPGFPVDLWAAHLSDRDYAS
jgi:hypothetical protein